MTRPGHAIDAYLEGQLTNEQARAIDTWIADGPANAAAFLQLARTHQALGIIGKERSLSRQAAEIQPDQLDPVTLASLAKMEAAAEAVPFDALDQPFAFEPNAKRQANRNTSLPQALDDLRWAAGKVASKLIRNPAFATTAVAAVLLLAFVLFNPWAGNDTPTDAPLALDDPNTPAASTASTPRGSDPVATITATHNAVWSSPKPAGDDRRGASLHPNDRLTLTAGFAEITTHDGAIAILEAPASIELIDHNNAIRLHAGKLVGICETESSKGFLVRTPAADIVDVGTRFGVVHDQETRLSVIEGEVTLKSTMSSEATPELRLTAGQDATLKVGQKTPTVTRHLGDRFVSRWSALSDMPRVEGQAIYEPSMPRSLFFHAYENPQIVVFQEGTGRTLSEDVPVTVAKSGREFRFEDPPTIVPAGTVLDSYFLHLDLPGKSDKAVTRRASIRFDRPILGVIATGKDLAITDDELGQAGVYYGPHRKNDPMTVRGIEPGTGEADVVEISEDRLTLTIDMRVLGDSIDQVRVLVESGGQAD